MRLERRQDLPANTPDLFHEEVMRQGAEVEVEEERVGAGADEVMLGILAKMEGIAPPRRS